MLYFCLDLLHSPMSHMNILKIYTSQKEFIPKSLASVDSLIWVLEICTWDWLVLSSHMCLYSFTPVYCSDL